MTVSNKQAIPSTQSQLVYPGTGLIAIPWYHLFLTIWNRTGGNSGQTSGLPTVVNAPIGTLITGAAMNAAVILRTGPAADFIDSTDNALNYLKARNFPVVPSSSAAVFINQTTANWTITPVNTVTFIGNLTAGNFVIPANSQRVFTTAIDNITNPAITIYA